MEAGCTSSVAALLLDVPVTLPERAWSLSTLWKTPDSEGRLSFCGCSCFRSAQEVPKLPCCPPSNSGHT